MPDLLLARLVRRFGYMAILGLFIYTSRILRKDGRSRYIPARSWRRKIMDDIPTNSGVIVIRNCRNEIWSADFRVIGSGTSHPRRPR